MAQNLERSEYVIGTVSNTTGLMMKSLHFAASKCIRFCFDVSNGMETFRSGESERTESGMLTRSGSVRLPEGEKIAFNLSEDDVFQNRASDASSGTRRLPTH